MIESPLLDELRAEAKGKVLLIVIQELFGTVPLDIEESIRAMRTDKHSEAILIAAMRSPDLDAFRDRLPELLPRPERE